MPELFYSRNEFIIILGWFVFFPDARLLLFVAIVKASKWIENLHFLHFNISQNTFCRKAICYWFCFCPLFYFRFEKWSNEYYYFSASLTLFGTSIVYFLQTSGGVYFTKRYMLQITPEFQCHKQIIFEYFQLSVIVEWRENTNQNVELIRSYQYHFIIYYIHKWNIINIRDFLRQICSFIRGGWG